MPRFKEQAICIRHIDWSETSQIVALLTESLGIVRGVAKGAKRMSPSSVQRFSGGIELLTLGQAVGSTKPTTELASLTEWDLQETFAAVRAGLAKQRLALYAADLVNAMLAPNDPHPRVFAALREMLEALCNDDRDDSALLRFQWVLLADCGYKPVLDVDVHTDSPLPDATSYTFDARGGGFTMRQADDQTSWQVRAETVDLLREVAASTDRNGPVKPSTTRSSSNPTAVSRGNRLLCVYLRTILDKALPTMRFVLDS